MGFFGPSESPFPLRVPEVEQEFVSVGISEHSAEWKRIKAHCEQQLAMHRRCLETVGLPQDETEGHRFAVAELKAILNLPKQSMIGPELKDEFDG